jgi:hypothetical protein
VSLVRFVVQNLFFLIHHGDPSAAFGRNQNLLSPKPALSEAERDAENAKKTGPRCSYPWRSWRLCARHKSLDFNILRSVFPEICA